MTIYGLSILAILVLIPDSTLAYSVKLNDYLQYEWSLDYNKGLVFVKVTYRPDDEDILETKDWVAIGFSDYGEFNQADFCLFAEDIDGNLMLQDVHTGINDTLARADVFNDCKNFQVEFDPDLAREISWIYSRKFDTCHGSEDYLIEDGTTHLLWAIGKGPISTVDGLDLVHPPSSYDHGFVRLRLLKVDVDFVPPTDAISLEVKHQILIPSDDTTYWCSVHKLPRKFDAKHHVIQYEPIISPGNEHLIHHMEVFHCVPEGDEDTFPMWEGPCGSTEAPPKLARCKKVLAAWAIGAGPFVYPEEAGLAIGGKDFCPYVMLEVHINNENMESGIVDESGIKFLVTEKLRREDAGIMELGLIYNDYMAIPPGQFMFPLRGFCLPECTEKGLPKDGITIFGSQLHTHGTGLRVASEHFRDGVPLPDINRDNHYSTHFQEIRELHEPTKIMPGDEIVTSCYYDTRKKINATVGGFGFSEEMCVNYVHYFPRTENLEICKSSVDHSTLQNFFRLLNEWRGENTNLEKKSAGDNYKSVSWSQSLSDVLESFYEVAPVQMQCTTASGEHLPGKWTHMEKPALQLEDTNPYRKRSSQVRKRKRSFELVKKRAGSPFNEMKKRQVAASEEKRDGQVLNEPQRLISKRPFSANRFPLSFDGKKKRSQKTDMDLQTIEDNIDEANSLLNEIESKLDRKKRPNSNGNTDELKPTKKNDDEIDDDNIEGIIAKMEQQIADAYFLLEELSTKDGINYMGSPGSQQSSESSRIQDNKKSFPTKTQNFHDFWNLHNNSAKKRLSKRRLNLPDEWSDYDTWGIDKKKKRLGSILDDVAT